MRVTKAMRYIVKELPGCLSSTNDTTMRVMKKKKYVNILRRVFFSLPFHVVYSVVS